MIEHDVCIYISPGNAFAFLFFCFCSLLLVVLWLPVSLSLPTPWLSQSEFRRPTSNRRDVSVEAWRPLQKPSTWFRIKRANVGHDFIRMSVLIGWVRVPRGVALRSTVLMYVRYPASRCKAFRNRDPARNRPSHADPGTTASEAILTNLLVCYDVAATLYLISLPFLFHFPRCFLVQ